MPRLNVEPLRRRQLIEATLQVLEAHGFQGTTIGRISKASGLSTGIVSHYFGGKQGLLEATMRHLLNELRGDFRRFRRQHPDSPQGRLQAIVDANFSGVQTQSKTARAWLIFWSQAAHSEDLARLQRIYERRLYSNLVYNLRPVLPAHALAGTAHTIAALIDGFWLRTALSEGRIGHARAIELCKAYIDQAIRDGAEQAPDDTHSARSGVPR
ncbi:MAG: transcriptional regulator BetI [Natronospirillum sp.]|uniref:transcriptional regulator BetI n=1 Tax=Natronospirillum sp. TaxID=2812955 RepID=UPI0025F2EC58|nr:transcriptional regulator BetI [Natronospirillum sp.]MCH8551994.1 transcriptional regulator BetI [Natronospirillum sp.]